MKIPRSRYPKIQENRAANSLIRRLQAIKVKWLPRLKANARRDDQADDNLFDQLQSEFEQAIQDWINELAQSGYEAQTFLKNQFIQQFRAAYGGDPRLFEPWTAADVDEMVKNVWRRCKGSAAEAVGKMRAVHSLGRRRGHSPAQMDQDIGKIFDTLEGRYRFAIRDEFSNMVAHTTRRRHESFGITSYIWRTRLDRRVRGRPDGQYPNARHSHWHREGLLFDYADPPEDGNPGEASGCRCVAEPVFPDHGMKDKGPGSLAWFLAGLAAGAISELNKSANQQ